MTALSLRVVWPVHDDAMFDREAMKAAAKDWCKHVERHRVQVVGAPQMRVQDLDDVQRRAFGAARAVVCVALVVRREEMAAA